MVKNCDLGLENAALGLRPRAREIGKALLNIKTLKGKQHKPQFTRSLKVYETMQYSLQLTHFLCIGLHMGQES